MERIAMSQEERDWLELLKRAKDKVVSQRKAAQTMGVSERWVRKLLQRMKSEGDGVVVHGLWQYCTRAVHKAMRGRLPYMVFPHGMLRRSGT